MMFGAQERLEACTTLDELKRVWSDIPASMKTALGATKEKMKAKLPAVQDDVTVEPV